VPNGLHLRLLMLLHPTLLHRDSTMTVLALFPFLRLTFSLHCVLCRLRKMAKLLPVRRNLHSDGDRQVTKRIMQNWLLHQEMLRYPPTTRMHDVHMLHHTQSVLMIDENSALRGNMPQRNDEEGCKTPRLSFSPASSGVGSDGPPLDDNWPR
jgi:hypothetical protein